MTEEKKMMILAASFYNQFVEFDLIFPYLLDISRLFKVFVLPSGAYKVNLVLQLPFSHQFLENKYYLDTRKVAYIYISHKRKIHICSINNTGLFFMYYPCLLQSFLFYYYIDSQLPGSISQFFKFNPIGIRVEFGLKKAVIRQVSFG